MKVMMLNSLDGLRSALSAAAPLAEEKAEALNSFSIDLAAVDEALDRLVRAAEAEMIPAADFERLLARYNELEPRMSQRFVAFESVATQAQINAWSAQNSSLLNELNQWVADVQTVVGWESSARNTKVVLLTLGAIALLGGGAYVLVRKYR